MTAIAVELPRAASPAEVGCSRLGCVERATACGRCLAGAGRSDEHLPLTDGQAFLILRVKLLQACVDGESFDSAWTFATAAVVALSPPGYARSWRRAVEAVRGEFAEAYRRKRVRLAMRNGVSHDGVLGTASGPPGG